ncbi:ATPase inhibitor mai-2, mitochondrial [Papilio xuthus]|uniref:Regulatory protein zeste n=1 Tax=Papilio xuthus TaxID=66420 RepID=A0A194Q3X7_PAPXU|nr:ATPase inhibitor mai-2, mitochondrial [Papilio xuthus]
MRKITSRRSRTPNWSLEEKQYLLELIKERKEVIVTKPNNGPNQSEEKDAAWNEILSELAAKFGNKFSESSIKKVKTQWQNMKRIAREEISQSGSDVQKCTRQSQEVCSILDFMKDDSIKRDDESVHETTLSANIEVKAESVDEDMIQSCDVEDNSMEYVPNHERTTNNNTFESSESSYPEQPEQMSEITEQENIEGIEENNNSNTMKNVCAMTDMSFKPGLNINPFHAEFRDFFNYSAAEKQLKLETLKEERQVARAMREAAELNKIIAEQKLKHVLWVKNIEMGMYSGEPGSGAGKGGGTGGAIRDAGGSFGKMQAAREEEYFYNKQKEQLSNMKQVFSQEIAFHQDQINIIVNWLYNKRANYKNTL